MHLLFCELYIFLLFLLVCFVNILFYFYQDQLNLNIYNTLKLLFFSLQIYSVKGKLIKTEQDYFLKNLFW